MPFQNNYNFENVGTCSISSTAIGGNFRKFEQSSMQGSEEGIKITYVPNYPDITC